MDMKYAKLLAAAGVLVMTAVLIYGFTAGDFRQDGSKLLQNPWGVVSFVDLYVGFALFSAWIVDREKSFVRSLVWVILMLLLGFLTAGLYALAAIYSSKGDWQKFWMGKRADEQN